MISDSHDPESRSEGQPSQTADEPAGCLRSSAVHNFQPVSETTETVRMVNDEWSVIADNCQCPLSQRLPENDH